MTMRAGKSFEPGIAGVRVAAPMPNRWQRWAARLAARAHRTVATAMLDRVYRRAPAARDPERAGAAIHVTRWHQAVHAHIAFRLVDPSHTLVAAPVAGAPALVLRDHSTRTSFVTTAGPAFSTTTILERQLRWAHHRHDTIERARLSIERWERSRTVRDWTATELVTRIRRRSERVAEELPARVVHRRVQTSPSRGDDQPAPPASRGPRGGADRAVAASGDRRVASAVEAPLGLDLRRVTDEVVRQIDHRLLARRERMGRV